MGTPGQPVLPGTVLPRRGRAAAAESRDEGIAAPLVLTTPEAAQPLAHSAMGTVEAAGAWSRDALLCGLTSVEVDHSTARLTLLPHYAIFTRYWEYEIIIPSDQILIMQHRG